MTYRKLLITIVSIWLTLNSLLMAQEEIVEAATESVTESSLITTTAAPEADMFYATCDFDLENIESLLPYLPVSCTEIYYNRTDSDLYDLYLEESQNFAKFYQKLNDYELRNETNGDKEELMKYPFEEQLRNETYRKVEWFQCLTSANSSITDYLNCLKSKRLEMAELIPNGEK